MMMSIGAISWIIAFAAAMAGQPVDPAPAQAPDWAEQPTADMVHAAFPEIALRLRVSGRARIKCEVNRQGRLENCVVAGETPTGWGFGRGALKMSGRFRMKPRLENGEPVAGSVTVPIAFIIHEGVVKVECGLTAEGLAHDCRSISEDPPGLDMGKAVVAYAEGRKPDRNASRSGKGKIVWGFLAPIPVVECAAGDTKYPCGGPGS